MSEEAFIYEAIRTPRGKNKNGALNEVKPVNLVTGLVDELRRRFPDLDETLISDMGFASQLGGAGAETVTKLLASAVYLFARHPDQWAKLRDDRSLVTAAVEELLRYDNPVHYDVRCSIKESTLHAVTIPVGKPVFLMLASANRDPEACRDR